MVELWFGFTLRCRGRDCLRHYQIATTRAIPYILNFLQRPSHCAPYELKDGGQPHRLHGRQSTLKSYSGVNFQQGVRLAL